MNKKKYLLLLIIFAIPFSILIGFSTWIIRQEIRIKPTYISEGLKYYLANDVIISSDVEVVYDGDSHGRIATIDPSSDIADADITYEYSIKGKDSFVEGQPTTAGDYDIKIIFGEYGYALYNFTILRADYDLKDVAWDYSEPFEYSGSNYTVTLTNLPAGISITSYANNVKTYAGTYSASVTQFTYDTVNYNQPIFSPLTWKIDPQVVDLPTVNNSFVYNGDIKIASTSTSTYSLSGDYQKTDAGNYSFTATLNDKSNYIWNNGTTNNAVIEWSIAKATPTITSWPILTPIYQGGQASISTDGIASVEGTFTVGNTKLLSYAATGTSTTSDSNHSVAVTFSPTNKNYVDVSGTSAVSIMSVAYNSVSNYYFGTVETALAATTSGNVFVIPGTNPTINNNCTVATNVTLILPFSGETYYAEVGGAYYDFSYGNTSYLHSNVTINSGVKLTVDGSLIVGGTISGGNGGYTAGNTCLDHAQITLLGTAGIEVTNSASVVTLYGYIAGTSSSYFNLTDGTLKVPLTIREHRGGTIFLAMAGGMTNVMMNNIELECSPFNRFFLANLISLKVTVSYSGQVVAMADLYANSEHNKTEMNLIGNASGNWIEFTSASSYLTYVFNYSTLKASIDIFGGANFNSLALTVKASVFTVSLSTEQVLFPLSWHFDITMSKLAEQDNATYNFAQGYKIMPGCIIKVNQGATLNADEIIIYETFNDVSVGATHLYEQKGPGKLIVNGTLNVGKIGGTIHSEVEGSQLNITSGVSMSSKEIITGDPTYTTISLNAKVYPYMGENVTTNLYSISTGSYLSKLDQSIGKWYMNGSNVTISYDTNGGAFEGTEPEPITGEVGENGYVISESDITTLIPVRQHYNFEGWYTDTTYTKSAVGATVYLNTSIVAKWSLVEYDISYKDLYYDTETGAFTTGVASTPHSNNPSKFTINTAQMAYEPTNGNYEFGGWYLDSACTIRINTFTGTELVNYLQDNTINLYAAWYPAGSEKYVINLVNSNTEVECQETDTIIYISDDSFASYSLPNLGSMNNDYDYHMYFDGWYLNDTKITSIDSNNANAIFTQDADGNYITTLTARWIEKYVVSISYNGEDYGTYYTYDRSVTLPTLSTLTTPQTTETYYLVPSIKYMINGVEYDVGDSLSVTEDTTAAVILTETYYYKVELGADNSTVTATTSGNLIYHDGSYKNSVSVSSTSAGTRSSTEIYVLNGATLAIAFTYNANTNNYIINKGSTQLATGSETSTSITIESSAYTVDATSEQSSSSGCIIDGSMILMADGTYKEVKDVKVGDMVLTWSFEEGKYVERPVIFYEVMKDVYVTTATLNFEDGSSIRLAYAQAFFDVNALEYVLVYAESAEKAIGKEFFFYEENQIVGKKVVSVTKGADIETVYEMIIGYDYGFIYDDILSVEPLLLHKLPFDVVEGFIFDPVQMQDDIEKYGLYTYDEWSDLLSMEEFYLFNGPYLKVAVEKGYYPKEYIVEIITTYFNDETMGRETY